MPPESATRRILAPLTAAILLAYFLFFTAKSIHLYFDQDDMSNLYFAWTKPVTANLRPLGALFYRVMFALAGFNPVPFRIVCLCLGIANMGLCFWFARLVTGSNRISALATLLFAYHPRLIEVWYRTAVIYDLLCFTFFYLAACLWIQARKRGAYPAPVRLVVILFFFICALEAKEIAVALPVVLLCYELVIERANWKKLWPIALMAVLNALYLYSKTHGANAMVNNPYYTPEYTYARFAGAWALYFNYLAIKENLLAPSMAVALLIALLLVAPVVRSRTLLFAFLTAFVATLPVSFIPYRGGFVIYIAYAAWTLYAAIVLVRLQDLLIRSHPQYRTALACLVFAIVAWRFGKISLHDQRVEPKLWLYDGPKLVRAMADQMRALHPTLPKGARTLFLDDPFATDEYTPYFIMVLLYRDPAIVVDRIKMMPGKSPDRSHYQYIFTCNETTCRE